LAQADYIPGTCNIGGDELRSRRIVAAVGLILSLCALAIFIATNVSQSARLGIFIPLLLMSIGWVQSRKKFCLAYGFAGTFNFGKLGQLSRVSDPIARAADRRTALMIFAQSILYAAVLTAVVVALPL
jgi:hypothetical protein